MIELQFDFYTGKKIGKYLLKEDWIENFERIPPLDEESITSEAMDAEIKKAQLEKLSKLLKISEKIRIDDIAEVLKLERVTLLVHHSLNSV